jgi:hypothetical protein
MPRKKKADTTRETPQRSNAAGETVSGYFRRIFAENPKLLKGRSNDAILRRWSDDHPGQEVTTSVRNGLQNIKSILRSRGRKRKRARQAAAAPPAPAAAPGAPRTPKGLPLLEEHIDDCLTLAKNLDHECLADVIAHLRRARNLVVWKAGE